MKHATKTAKENRTGPYDYKRHWSQVKSEAQKKRESARKK